MTTLIESLPLLRASQGVGLDEDWIASFAFTDASGAALSLSGITFAATVAAQQAAIAGVVAGNVVTFTVYAAAKTTWPPGTFAFAVLATDGTFSKDILVGSALTVGDPAALTVSIVSRGGASTSASVVSPQTAANTAAIAALQQIAFGGQPTIVSAASYTILAPGWYLITTQGAVLTLPALGSGQVIITDATGSSAPNISIVGTVNGDAGGALLTTRGQSVTLAPVSALNSWWMQ